MSLKRAWMLAVGLLLVIGILGCGQQPGPVEEPKAVPEPTPVARPGAVGESEPVAEPERVAEEPKRATVPEVGRDAAIAEIEKLGGVYGGDKESPDRPIVGVWLRGTQVTDAALEHLKGLTNLQELQLHCPQVTYAGLEHLKGLTSLQRLVLDRTQVTRAGVSELKRALPNCEIPY